MMLNLRFQSRGRRPFVAHQRTDGFVEGGAQDVAEDQESQPLAFLRSKAVSMVKPAGRKDMR